ncbi:hypothetical protein V1477_000466 [Vespula maculifrons]|uniref:Uncharacterized protein n=1 Tax=Vespula maculifrons TaxID=7453 RepID=A0ABD2D3T6_VESMC
MCRHCSPNNFLPEPSPDVFRFRNGSLFIKVSLLANLQKEYLSWLVDLPKWSDKIRDSSQHLKLPILLWDSSVAYRSSITAHAQRTR